MRVVRGSDVLRLRSSYVAELPTRFHPLTFIVTHTEELKLLKMNRKWMWVEDCVTEFGNDDERFDAELGYVYFN